MVKTFGGHSMTMLYPSLLYNQVCYKEIVLYVGNCIAFVPTNIFPWFAILFLLY